MQFPAATVPVQVAVPSVTVTLPVGVPLPGEFTATPKLTRTPWPTTDGLGVCELMVVAVSAGLTVCDTAALVLPLKLFPLPGAGQPAPAQMGEKPQ